MIYEIKDIYQHQKKENTPMLSSYISDFWEPYTNNFTYFDKIFMKKYRSWFPMDQEGELSEISREFSDDVYGWLMINDKRYSELFRIQTIPDDEKYSLTDNVYEHEIIERDTTSSASNIKGSETITDTNENIYGSQSDSESKSITIGSQSDSENISKSYGAGSKTIENGTSAFNESEYTNTDRSVESDAAKIDTETNTYTHGSHTDTETNSYTHGSHTDSSTNTRVDGQRTDSSTGTGSEDIERIRSGNIGVKTVVQMLGEQWNIWDLMNFYDLIFSEISRELLRGC